MNNLVLPQLFEIKTSDAKVESNDLINEFLIELKKERGDQTHYINPKGKKVKLSPLCYMGVQRKLFAIKDNVKELRYFLSKCKEAKSSFYDKVVVDNNGNKTNKRVYGSFSKYFFGSLK